MRKVVAALLLVGILTCGCGAATPTPLPTLPPTPAPTATPSSPPPTATPAPPTPTPTPWRVWIDPAVPLAVRDEVLDALAAVDTSPASSAAQSDLRIGLNMPLLLARWVYAVVVPFPTLTDEVTWAEVLRFWAGEPGALTAISDGAESPSLFVAPETLGVLHGLLGPSSSEVPITIVEPDELLDRAWASRPHAWAVVPFENLRPRWKVLKVDGASVLDKGLRVERYPLAVSIGAEGQGTGVLASSLSEAAGPLTNREADQITTLVMTGVTAMVRGIAHRMEQEGILYPAEHLRSLLKEADLLHISNEISFATACPPPDPNTDSLAFCSDPRYIELLRAVGTDVVELTGNHVRDYGSQPMLDTLEMYCDEGWFYYGGGKNLEDARESIVVHRNGAEFAFVGCNPVGPDSAWATADRPGAAPCETEHLQGQLTTLKDQVDVPVATLQYWELYQYEPTLQQRLDFRSLVDAGAVIVSGSQSHHPQAIEFYQDGFIHYGLGNLFFDQMWSLGTRQEFVDRHVIYQGRHISTELLTFMLEDYSQPRPMTAEERRGLLKAVFEASGW